MSDPQIYNSEESFDTSPTQETPNPPEIVTEIQRPSHFKFTEIPKSPLFIEGIGKPISPSFIHKAISPEDTEDEDNTENPGTPVVHIGSAAHTFCEMAVSGTHIRRLLEHVTDQSLDGWMQSSLRKSPEKGDDWLVANKIKASKDAAEYLQQLHKKDPIWTFLSASTLRASLLGGTILQGTEKTECPVAYKFKIGYGSNYVGEHPIKVRTIWDAATENLIVDWKSGIPFDLTGAAIQAGLSALGKLALENAEVIRSYRKTKGRVSKQDAMDAHLSPTGFFDSNGLLSLADGFSSRPFNFDIVSLATGETIAVDPTKLDFGSLTGLAYYLLRYHEKIKAVEDAEKKQKRGKVTEETLSQMRLSTEETASHLGQYIQCYISSFAYASSIYVSAETNNRILHTLRITPEKYRKGLQQIEAKTGKNLYRTAREAFETLADRWDLKYIPQEVKDEKDRIYPTTPRESATEDAMQVYTGQTTQVPGTLEVPTEGQPTINDSGKKWIFRHNPKGEIPLVLDPENLATVILSQRGIPISERANFSNPQPWSLEPERLGLNKRMWDLSLATILQAVVDGKRILGYGDFDVDGFSALSLFLETLDKIGSKNFLGYIPNRLTNGYGLTTERIDYLMRQGFLKKGDVLVNFDSGVGMEAGKAAEKAVTEDGIVVILNDHHENIYFKNGLYRHPNLLVNHTNLISAGTISYLLSQNLFEDARVSPYDQLDYATLSTVSDVMSMKQIANRYVARSGISSLQNTKRENIILLAEKSGIRINNLTMHDIGWRLGPAINACGRLGYSSDGLAFMRSAYESKFRSEALNYTNRLIQHNSERRAIQREHEKVYERIIAKQVRPDDLVIVAGKKDTHEGIIGLLASSVAGETHRPAAIFNLQRNSEGPSKASLRSNNVLVDKDGENPDSFSISTLIQESIKNGLAISGGGHKKAGAIKVNDIDAFRDFAQEEANRQGVTHELVQPQVRIDIEIPDLESINAFYEEIIKMEPFGEGFEEITILVRGLTINGDPRLTTTGNHINFRLSDKHGNTELCFGQYMGDRYKKLKNTYGSKADIVGTIGFSTYLGKPQFTIKDIKIVPDYPF